MIPQQTFHRAFSPDSRRWGRWRGGPRRGAGRVWAWRGRSRRRSWGPPAPVGHGSTAPDAAAGHGDSGGTPWGRGGRMGAASSGGGGGKLNILFKFLTRDVLVNSALKLSEHPQNQAQTQCDACFNAHVFPKLTVWLRHILVAVHLSP